MTTVDPTALATRGLRSMQAIELSVLEPFRQRHPQRFEDDALNVVFGLSFGQAKRVDLHSIPKASKFGISYAVTTLADFVPHLSEGPHFADFFNESDSRVHKERDAPHYPREIFGGHLTRITYSIKNIDRVRKRVCNFLNRCRSGLLKVIATNIDRVPQRNVL